MNHLNIMFRNRLGISPDDKITFATLDDILLKMALAFPFENLRIIAKNVHTITRESLIEKLLDNQEGGLCYELNPLLYFFLLEHGFDVKLVRGRVFNNATNNWSETGRTHVAILLQHKGQRYVIDSGFGGSVPLKPVPFDEEVTSSRNGDFRVHHIHSEHGDYVFELKLKYKDPDWRIGYVFDSTLLLEDLDEVNDIQDLIVGSEESNFNKGPLITQMTNDGSMTLTNSSFTRWVYTKQSKEEIDEKQFKALAREHFGLQP